MTGFGLRSIRASSNCIKGYFIYKKYTTTETTGESFFQGFDAATDVYNIKTVVTDWRAFMVRTENDAADAELDDETSLSAMLVVSQGADNQFQWYFHEWLYSRHNNSYFYVTETELLIWALYAFGDIHQKILHDPKTHISFTDINVEVEKSG